MLKKVLSVVLALVLVLGICAVAASAATSSQLAALLQLLPNEYNAYFYKDATMNKILAAREAADAALASGDATAINAAYAQCQDAYDEAYDYVDYEFNDYGETVAQFKNRDESKAVIDLWYETEAPEYLMPGDTFDITIYIKSNFPIFQFAVGLAYEKDKFTFDVPKDDGTPLISFPEEISTKLNTTLESYKTDWGWYNGEYVTSDNRRYYPPNWDQDMIDKYNLVEKALSLNYKNTKDYFYPAEKTELCTLTVKVKDDVKLGDTGEIFVCPDLISNFDNFYAYDGAAYPVLWFRRAYAENAYEYVAACDDQWDKADNIIDQYCFTDHTVNYEGTALKTYTFGEAPAEPLDYTALEAAVAEIKGFDSFNYTDESWAAYEEAVAAGSDELTAQTAETQDDVDAFTKAVTDARDALVPYESDSEILLITEKTTPVLTQNTTLEVLVAKPVTKLQFVETSGNTYTYYDGYSRTLSIVNNDDGTQTWTIVLTYRNEGEKYNVHVKNVDSSWSSNMYRYAPTERDEYDTKIISVSVPDAEKYGRMKAGVHDLVVTTGVDVLKVQLIRNGITSTYTPDSEKATVVEKDGKLEWTISYNFCNIGDPVVYEFNSRSTAYGWEKSDITLEVGIVR